MQKRIVALGLLVIITIIISFSCDKNKGSGTLRMQLNPKVEGSALDVLGTIYIDPVQDVRYKITNLQFYISNIILTKKDNSTVSLSKADDVRLFKWKDEIINSADFKIPAGEYSKITFTIGLTDAINATVPDDYNTDHPLGSNSGNYWIMNNSFIFSRLEGFVDSSNTSGAPLSNSFIYHIGGNSYTRDVTLNKEFVVDEDAVSDFPISMEVDKLWNGPTPLIFKTEMETHTTNKPDIANRLLNNYAASFIIE